jgi:chemotaxis protein histidine kinase CheA
VLDLIKDPLTHMVRNSADHGLETPAERRAAGKPESRAQSRKAKAHELVTEAELEKLTEAQIYKFIFVPGFSRATEITSVSGRGVGMDVVRTNIDQIGGTIDVWSVPGVPIHFCRPAVDPLFCSAAQVWGGKCLGLVLWCNSARSICGTTSPRSVALI